MPEAISVLALVTDAYGGYGGIARFNRDLVEALAALDGVGAIDVLPRLAPEGEVPPGPKIRPHAPRRGRILYAATAANCALRRRPRVVLNGHLYHSPLSRIIARAAGARMVSVLHGTEVWSEIPDRLAGPLACSDAVICVSRDTEARIVRRCPSLDGRTVVTYNTLGPAFIPGDREAARARFGIGGEFVILTVARLDGRGGYKGHDRIIPLLSGLRAAGRDVAYLIAGTGPDRSRLEALAAAHAVADRVRFLGKVPAEELPDLYRAADLFALPSTGEGFGIVYIEAMGCGTPAIGLAVGGAPEALGSGSLGTVVAPEEFAEGLRSAVRNVEGMQMAARSDLSRRVHEKFGAAAFRDRVAVMVRDRLG